MYYRRCESCGSKALATATRCPRCECAFELNDAHGKRHRLVPCRKCKVVQPATVTTCRWCGHDRNARAAFPQRTIGIASGAVAAAALLIATRGTVVPIVQSSLDSMSSSAAEVFSGVSRQDVQPAAPAASTIAAPTSVSTLPAADTAMHSPATSVPAGVADSVSPASNASSPSSWEEVKATTWVNVRADRKRDASILAVLNPDEVVRLGAKEAGWRPVNVAGATGWVDARHFTPSSRQ